MEYTLLKVGSDAEFFVQQNAVPIPICGRLGGTKADPKPVLSGNGYAVQEDNVAVEFNIPPASTASEFAHSIATMLAYLKAELAKQDLTVAYRSEENFTQEVLHQFPDAYRFGCEPDFCVWTRTVNPSPEAEPYFVVNPLTKAKEAVEQRCAGFHIHVSYLVDGRQSTLEEKEMFVKAQDIFLGVPLTLMDINAHRQHVARRRRWYGSAGAFRPKEYGHEYRVLGSSVLTADYGLNEWIFEANQRAIRWLNQVRDPEPVFHDNRGHIMAAINQYSTDHCRHLMQHFGLSLP